MKKILLLLSIVFVTATTFGQATGYVLPNFASSGSIGTASTTVDVYSRININQTTPSITLSIPNPTNTSTKVTEVWVGNIGTVSFSLAHCGVIDTATCVILKWTGSNYSVIGRKAVTSGSGTVTSVSIVSANGVSGAVSNPTTTPAVTLSLGAITPTSVVASGAISGSNISGTNTGDQTNITGNAGTVTTNANLTGDVTSVGNATTLSTTSVTAGSYTNTNITVDSKGRLTSASNGTGGGGAPTGAAGGDLAGTYPNPTVAGQVVKSVVLNTPNVIFANPVTFTTATNTATGTLALNAQAAKTVLAGPSTGSTATPTFRVLVPNDIPTPQSLGTLFSLSGAQWNSATIPTTFTKVGSGTYTFGSNKLVISAGSGSFTDYVYYTSYQSNLNDVSVKMVYTLDNANTMGTGITVSKIGGTVTTFQLDHSTSSASKLNVLIGGVVQPIEFNDNTLSASATDVITLTVTECKNKYIFSAEVLHSGVRTEQTVTYTAPLYVDTQISGQTVFGIANLGGSQSINSFNVYGETQVGLDLIVVGDSYLQGFNSPDNNNTLASLIEARTYSRVGTWAKIGNTTQNLIDSQAELLSLAPKNVYINIGANDMGGTPSVVFSSLQTFVATLQAAGINVVIGKVYPRATGFANTVTFNGLIDATYSSSMIVDMFTPLVNSAGTSYNSKYGNGVHLNIEGERVYIDVVWNKLKTFLIPKNSYESESNYFNKRYSSCTQLGYSNVINSTNPTFLNPTGAINSTQTVIPFAVNPYTFGFRKGIAIIKYSTQNEYINITGIDEIANTITVDRAQLGSTNLATAGTPGIQMVTYMNSTSTQGPVHSIEQGNMSVFAGGSLGTFQNTHTFYTTGGGSNGLAVINPATNGSAFSLISRQSTSANAALRFMTGTANTYDIICQGSADLSIGRASQTDLYLTGGMFGFGTIPSGAYVNIKEGNSTIAPLRLTGCSLALSAASGNGSQATFTFAVTQPVAPFKANSLITIAGCTPTGYNNQYFVVSCTTTQVVVGSTTTGSLTVNGVITQGAQTSTLIPGTIEVSASGDRITHVPFGATFARQSIAYLSDIKQQVIGGQYTGTGTATTTYTVTIPTQANTTYKVNVEPTNALTAVMQYATNKTTTSFDVTFVTALTGAVAFDWTLVP